MMDWKKIDPKKLDFQYPLLLATIDKRVSFFNNEYDLKQELMLQRLGLSLPEQYTHWTHITLPL